MKPNYRIGDIVQTKYNYVGVVTDRTPNTLTLDRHRRIKHTDVARKLKDAPRVKPRQLELFR